MFSEKTLDDIKKVIWKVCYIPLQASYFFLGIVSKQLMFQYNQNYLKTLLSQI